MKKFMLYMMCILIILPLSFSCNSDLIDEKEIEELREILDLPADGGIYPFSLYLTVSNNKGEDLINQSTPDCIDTTKMKIYTLKEGGVWEQRKDSVYYNEWPFHKVPHIVPLYTCTKMVSADSTKEFNLLEFHARIGPRIGCLSHSYWFQWDDSRSDTITFIFDHPYSLKYEDAYPSAMYVNGKEEKPLCLVHLVH